jgi:hypothetical protein
MLDHLDIQCHAWLWANLLLLLLVLLWAFFVCVFLPNGQIFYYSFRLSAHLANLFIVPSFQLGLHDILYAFLLPPAYLQFGFPPCQFECGPFIHWGLAAWHAHRDMLCLCSESTHDCDPPPTCRLGLLRAHLLHHFSSSFQGGCPLCCYTIYDTKVSLCYKWTLLCYHYDYKAPMAFLDYMGILG